MKETPVIAFEGVNRVGKGTQIKLLEKKLIEFGIDSIVLRGDGTRNGDGSHEGDPYNNWWRENANKIRLSNGTCEWNIAAEKLMVEFINWKQKINESSNKIILLDRFLISRAAFLLDRSNKSMDFLDMNILYPVNSQKFTIKDILPDLIIELFAPQKVLYSRLDRDDPKYNFRKTIIEKGYKSFVEAETKLPGVVREKIVKINSSRSKDLVFGDVLETVKKRIEI